ncbi:hypothetical protein MLD38_005561 [Melastoma candidum]|uniref:Uncharacterized protein n=1 Tax=Melastoma candidum TaxID=119954 RepID=A0ACB9RL87_9MYRT|nr:hypothetical protein MLD38_005561 [Melastoma candidum]
MNASCSAFTLCSPCTERLSGRNARCPMEEKEEDDGRLTPTSSPPTPPSPLPVSVGPGNQKYDFSLSPTPSPPFSPHGSSHTSAENLPLLAEASIPAEKTPLAFSVDCRKDDEADDDSQGRNCLKDLLEWFLRRCCNCLVE